LHSYLKDTKLIANLETPFLAASQALQLALSEQTHDKQETFPTL
jgi:hypothetical protein